VRPSSNSLSGIGHQAGFSSFGRAADSGKIAPICRLWRVFGLKWIADNRGKNADGRSSTD
jgi:hypothetical protein